MFEVRQSSDVVIEKSRDEISDNYSMKFNNKNSSRKEINVNNIANYEVKHASLGRSNATARSASRNKPNIMTRNMTKVKILFYIYKQTST